MKVTVTTLSDEIFNLDVTEDLELENFKALLEFETGVPAREIGLVWNGRPLHDDKRTLKNYGIKENDMLLLQRMQGAQGRGSTGATGATGAPAVPGAGLPEIDFGSIQIPGTSSGSSGGGRPPPASSQGLPDDPATIRDMLLSSPHELALLKERNPPLAEALLSGSLEKFTEVLKGQQKERADKEADKIRLLNADPFDPEIQNKIAEEIRLKNVESNMETAMEYAPESFGQVVMLYIDCMVNGHPVKAFVDSGAQMTIMSQQCAVRCNIMRLVDTRWSGLAKGVGTQKIIGRVHLGQIQIGPDFLQSSFSLLEEQPMDMLLGLDMLKRHQCSIDLKNNLLVIGTTGTKTPFLSEADLPEHARLNRTPPGPEAMDEDQQLADALNKSAAEASAASKPGTSGNGGSGGSGNNGAASSASSRPNFPESDINKLTANGFSREQAVQELTNSGGDVDQALAALFAKSFTMP